MTPAELAVTFPATTFEFDLSGPRGFVPPPAVARLKEFVTLNVALGAHYFFTLVQHREPTFGLVLDFLSSSTHRNGRHVFHGSSFGDDAEFAVGYSQQFAKFVGIAFMAEYAGSTWFAPLERLWDDGVSAADGHVSLCKRHPRKEGPDYLAAPFDPTVRRSADPLYVLEFKGRSRPVDFKHDKFVEWRKQARNIIAKVDGHEVKLKSWILAFNYAFENLGPRNSRLLVEDPWTASADKPPIEATRRNTARVVREHLARQCTKFGAGMLGAPVLAGRMPEPAVLPRVYKVQHHLLRSRRYIGHFAARRPDGELVWMPARLPMIAGRLDVDVFDDGSFNTAVVLAPDRQRILVHHRGPLNEESIRRMMRSLLDGDEEVLFIGQDASMLRGCMQTPVEDELDGEPFAEMIEFQGNTDVGQTAEQGFVQVLRNGAVLADASLVVEDEESGDWWHGG